MAKPKRGGKPPSSETPNLGAELNELIQEVHNEAGSPAEMLRELEQAAGERRKSKRKTDEG